MSDLTDWPTRATVWPEMPDQRQEYERERNRLLEEMIRRMSAKQDKTDGQAQLHD